LDAGRDALPEVVAGIGGGGLPSRSEADELESVGACVLLDVLLPIGGIGGRTSGIAVREAPEAEVADPLGSGGRSVIEDLLPAVLPEPQAAGSEDGGVMLRPPRLSLGEGLAGGRSVRPPTSIPDREGIDSRSLICSLPVPALAPLAGAEPMSDE
jgi:hypothetical protein